MMVKLMPMVRRMGLAGVSILIVIYTKVIIKKVEEMVGAGTYITIVNIKKENGRIINHMEKVSL